MHAELTAHGAPCYLQTQAVPVCMKAMHVNTDGLRHAQHNPCFIMSQAEWRNGVVKDPVTVSEHWHLYMLAWAYDFSPVTDRGSPCTGHGN